MNIAIIVSEYPNLNNKGGVATFSYHLAQILKQGNNVHVFTLITKKSTEKILSDDGVTVHLIQNRSQYAILNFLYYKFPFGVFRFLLTKLKCFEILETIDWNVFSTLTFIDIHSKIKFDAIHYSSLGCSLPVILLFRKKIPCILQDQMLNKIISYEKSSINFSFLAWVETAARKLSTRIVSNTNASRTELLAKHPELEAKTSSIHFFINSKQYQDSAKINKYNIVFYGRLEYRKGPDILLDVYTKLHTRYPKLQVWFIGKNEKIFLVDNTYHNFRDIVQKRSNYKVMKNIHLISRIDDKTKLITLLSSLKGIAVFPSRYEPFGFVVVEAMATGFVTIASTHGGGPEIIDHGINGYLTNPDSTSLYNTLDEVLHKSNRELLGISKNGVQKVKKHFDYKQAQEKYRLLYKSISL